MVIATDISVTVAGDFRWTGDGSTTHTVLAFHRYIGALMDDAQAAGDDLLDITSETASDRSTDQIITLNSPYNIDDTLAEHLFDGSITQNGGDDVYSGLSVVGTVVSGTQPMLVQDDKALASYWGEGINSDAANLIIMKVMIKSREGGADIDGKRIKLLSRELGDQYREFPVTLGLANSVGAISNQADLNNTTAEATIEAWTIINTEGFQELDIDGTGAAGQEYYSQWDPGTQSINDTYEESKRISQRAHVTDNGTDGGTNYIVDDATIIGQGQEFSAETDNEKLVEMRFLLRVGSGTPVGVLVAELYLSDDAGAGAAEPTGGLLATSVDVLVSRLSSVYQEFIFRFNDNVTLTGGEDYFAVIRNVAADASNFVYVQGAAAGADDGNRAEETGAWLAAAASDLWFTVKSCPIIHSIAGEKFRGIDFEILYDVEASGPFQEDEIVFWGTDITYDGLSGGPFTEGEYVTFDIGGTIHNAGKILRDNGSVQMMVALEKTSGGTLADGDIITGLSSGATGVIDTTIVDQTDDGGEGFILALDDNGADGELYLQLISGKAPVDNLPIEGRTSGATADVAVTVNTRVTSPEFLGASTGTNIIGAYGIGFKTDEVGASDQFTSLDNTTRVPPNNVTITITGLVSGEDRILIGPRTAGLLDKAQMILNTTLSSSGETAVVLTAAIPAGTPNEGTSSNSRIRVENDDGIYRRQDYTSFTGSTFTIPSTAYDGAQGSATFQAASTNDVFVAYIDVLADATSELYTAVHTINVDLLVRVRDGGASPIKTIENPITFTSASASFAIVRQTDL